MRAQLPLSRLLPQADVGRTPREDHFYRALSREDRMRFDALAMRAPTTVHRDALWKALAAEYPVADIETFAKRMESFLYEEELEATLNLRNLTQQHGMSCEVSSAQVIEGEHDPIYALDVRLANPDIHRYHPRDEYGANYPLATEQRAWLERFGGKGGALSGQQGRSLWGSESQKLWDTKLERTGVKYGDERKLESGYSLKKLLDDVEAQVRKGIHTPLVLESPKGTGCHSVVAMEVVGKGNERVFKIYDPHPHRGDVVDVTYEQMSNNELPLEPWTRLRGYRPGRHEAKGEVHPREVLPELRDLPPAPPPSKPDVGEKGNVRGTLKPLYARDADGNALGWVYCRHEYDWNGRRIQGSAYFEDENGKRIEGVATVMRPDGSVPSSML